MIITAQHISAGRDINGNSRLLILSTAVDPFTGGSATMAVVVGPEGFRGAHGAPAAAVHLPALTVAVEEFDRLATTFGEPGDLAAFRVFVGGGVLECEQCGEEFDAEEDQQHMLCPDCAEGDDLGAIDYPDGSED